MGLAGATGTHPHAQWRMFRGRKHTRSARIDYLKCLGPRSRRAAVTSRRACPHGRQLCARDTATLARHPSQQAAHHLPCGRPPDFFGPPATPSFRAPCDRFRRPWYPRFDIEHACSYGPRGNLTLEGLSSCFPTYRVYIFSTLFIGAYRVCFVYSVFCFLARPPSPFLQAFSSGGLFFLFCFFSRTVTLHLSPLPAARQNGAIDLQGDQNYVSTHVYLVHMYT